MPCLFILSVYLERNLSASLVVPDRYVPKGEKFEVDVHVSNASVLPMSTVPVTLLCHSRLSSRRVLIRAMPLLRQAQALRFAFTCVPATAASCISI